MGLPSAKELMKAQLQQNTQMNGYGGGFAAQNARNQAMMRWMNSPTATLMRQYNASPQQMNDAFDQYFSGGATSLDPSRASYGQDLNRAVDKAFYGGGGGGGGSLAPVKSSYRGGSVLGDMASQRPNANGALGSGGISGMTPDQIQALFMLGMMKDEKSRNDAVKKRENELRDSMDNMYGRVMGRVENYGKAESDNIKERSYEMRKANEARNAARGLGNSTIDAAFAQRSGRDESRLLQQLAENVDARTIDYDINLTRDKQRMVEGITDRIPDTNMLMQIAQQMGSSGMLNGGGQSQMSPQQQAIEQMLAGRQRIQAPQSRLSGPPMTAWGPARQTYGFGAGMPIQVNPYGAWWSTPTPIGPITSNRYPQKPPQKKQKPIAKDKFQQFMDGLGQGAPQGPIMPVIPPSPAGQTSQHPFLTNPGYFRNR